MKFTFITILLFCSFGSISQILDSISYLEEKAILYHKEIFEADEQVLKDDKKYNYLYFVPSVGYDFIYNRPMISYNFAQIGSFLKSKHQNENQIKALNKRYNLSIRRTLISLNSKFDYCNILFERFDRLIDIYDLNYKLFELNQEKYKNNEITIEEFIKSEIQIKRQRQSLDNLNDRIIILISEIESLTACKVDFNIKTY